MKMNNNIIFNELLCIYLGGGLKNTLGGANTALAKLLSLYTGGAPQIQESSNIFSLLVEKLSGSKPADELDRLH